MTHLYLTRSDIKLGFSQGQLVVKGSADEPERRLPFCNVESINVFGNPQISTQLVRECLKMVIILGGRFRLITLTHIVNVDRLC